MIETAQLPSPIRNPGTTTRWGSSGLPATDTETVPPRSLVHYAVWWTVLVAVSVGGFWLGVAASDLFVQGTQKLAAYVAAFTDWLSGFLPIVAPGRFS